MGMLTKLRMKLADLGWVSLNGANMELRENEEYVGKVLFSRGAEEFAYAGDYLRSDADFIIKHVGTTPEILKFCADTIYDRYMEDCFMPVEEPVDEMVFAVKCCEENELAIEHLPLDVAVRYYEASVRGDMITGIYHGQKFEKMVKQDAVSLTLMLLVRPEIREHTNLKAGSIVF